MTRRDKIRNKKTKEQEKLVEGILAERKKKREAEESIVVIKRGNKKPDLVPDILEQRRKRREDKAKINTKKATPKKPSVDLKAKEAETKEAEIRLSKHSESIKCLTFKELKEKAKNHGLIVADKTQSKLVKEVIDFELTL